MDTTNNDWIRSTNVYEVNVRQYTPEGTFAAFAKHLPRLKEMGVHTLWFMPVTPIAQKNKKGSLGSYYAASDYTAINPEFGTHEDFKKLVQEAHRLHFKVIIDWVANHTGWDHRWTYEHPQFYKKEEATGTFKIASGMDDIIELDYNNSAMRQAMIAAMRFWIEETDIDGFRCDLASWVTLDFWQQAKRALEGEKKLFWLGELDPLENGEYMQVFDAGYSWAWMHKTEAFYKQRLPLQTLVQLLLQYQNTPGLKAWFTANHDENSWNGTEYEKYGEAAKALAVFSCTWPGVPLLYSGQELPNHKRLKFFDKDVIEWNDNYAVAPLYKTLLHLHSTHPALLANAGLQKLATTNDAQVLAYLRYNGGKEVLVLLNLSPNEHQVRIITNDIKGRFTNVFSKTVIDVDGHYVFQMQPWQYIVLEK